ncbi:MAG: hypothetical protein LBT64_00290, partial [Puniceicoccales bacterium]|nr:hypothetical protein [Puniceicoccales bacterium]
MERTVVNVTEQKNLEQILMDPKQIDSDPEKIKDTIVSHIESIDGDTYAAASNAMLSSEVNPSFLSDDDRKITFSFSKGNSDLGVHCKNVENLTVEDLEKKGVFEKNAKVDVIEDLLKETQIGKDFFRAKSATVKIGNTTIEYANDNKNPEVKAETTAKIWQAILDFADEKCSDKLEAERREFILNCIKSFCVSAGQGDTWIPQIINAIPPLNKNEGTYGIITNIAAYSNKITRNISIDENCSKCSV